jgi:hypothetical protein
LSVNLNFVVFLFISVQINEFSFFVFLRSLVHYYQLIFALKRSMSLRSVRFGVRSRKLSKIGQPLDGSPKIFHLELLRASEGTLSRWSRLHLQSSAPTNPHWARVVGYGPFSLCVIHKEGLCHSSGDIYKRLMMIRTAETQAKIKCHIIQSSKLLRDENRYHLVSLSCRFIMRKL